MASDEFSIITYNIHKGLKLGGLKSVLPEIRDALHFSEPDLIFLQEVRGKYSNWLEKNVLGSHASDQSRFLAEKLWPHAIYEKNAVYQSGDHGNAILSKYPFLGHQNINVSKMLRASRSILHARVSIQDKTVHLLCVHLGLFKIERATQIATLIKRVVDAVPPDAPLLIAGDFNDWRFEQGGAHLIEQDIGCQEALKQLTGDYAKSFPAVKPLFPVDRIYYRGLEVVRASCLNDKPWRTLSDHLPLYARFKLL
jgi:endonuclease/exonuclease/phosphatase family metal-dependent hydrolase